jgi:hypothetical protein
MPISPPPLLANLKTFVKHYNRKPEKNSACEIVGVCRQLFNANLNSNNANVFSSAKYVAAC